MKHCCFLTLMFTTGCFLAACNKYLDKNPDKSLTIPSSMSNLRGLMDNYAYINGYYPAQGALADDDHYTPDNNAYLDQSALNSYLWGKGPGGDIGNTANESDWRINYLRINYANVVLDYIDKVTNDGFSEEQVNSIKGEAYFVRGMSFFRLAQIYCTAYDPQNADGQMGLPVTHTSSVGEKIQRWDLKKTYESICADLLSASMALPVNNTPLLRPNRKAAFAALSWVGIVTQDFSMSVQFADSCLKYSSGLLDYKNMSSTSSAPFALYNNEVLWQANLLSVTALSTSAAYVDKAFYQSFASNDYRKSVFFAVNKDSSINFKGYYNGKANGTTAYFGGLALDEVFLNKAEAEVRLNRLDEALGILNDFRSARYNNPAPVPSNILQQDLVDTILAERRKEFCFRSGYRWMEVKRLNVLQSKKTVLQRTYLGVNYSLAPDDPHYCFLIPQSAVSIGGIQQNER